MPLPTRQGVLPTKDAFGSSIVQLSSKGLAAQAAAATANPPTPTALRFKGLGATMLERLGAGQPVPADQAALPQELDNRFSLKVATIGGSQVELILGNRGDDMFSSISTDAVLDEQERAALAGLAQGFQKAIDAMAQGQPAVRLAGLADLSGTPLASIEFASEITLPTEPEERMALRMTVDDHQRSVDIDGTRGKIGVHVDTSRPELLGDSRQQDKAIGRYLQQFDAAAQRGRGDEQLVSMFKDAFSDLARTAPRAQGAAATPPQPGRWNWSRDDHAALTGLSDFEAVIEQAGGQPNPPRRDEVTGFRYEAGQQSTTRGDKFADRGVSQQQTSRLSAQFHTPLQPGATLAFDFRSETQNYHYHQIDDEASSKVELDYKDGRLRKATLEQTVHESERVRKYVLGKMVSDRTIPEQQSLMRDLVATLAPYQPRAGNWSEDISPEAARQQRRMSLDALNDAVLLPGSRRELAERAR